MIFNPRVVQLTGARIALLPPSDLAASAGNTQVSLTWTDPGDETSGGQVVAEWEFTRIVRKVGSAPANQNDGVIVVDSTVKNQYMSEPFVDTGLTNDTTYYYGAFACSAAGAWSDGAFVSAVPVAGTPIGELAEGTLITIQENGAPVEFYVADHDYQSNLNGNGRTLMVRKDAYIQMDWNSSKMVDFASSNIFSYLNSSYASLLSANVRQMIGSTIFPYSAGVTPVVSDMEGAIFLLSLTEFGLTSDVGNVEGSAIPIGSRLRICMINGTAISQWTRSPETHGSEVNIPDIQIVNQLGSASLAAPKGNPHIGARPIFTLPSTALVDPSNALIES